MLSPIFVSSESRSAASHVSAGIEAYSHWRKAAAMYVLFLSWTILMLITAALSSSTAITWAAIVVSVIVLLSAMSVAYLNIDRALSPRGAGGLGVMPVIRISTVLLMVYVGFLLLIIPGMIMSYYFAAAPAYIARGDKLGDALKKSKKAVVEHGEGRTAQVLMVMLTASAFVPPLVFLVMVLPMLVGIAASVAESHPDTKYVPSGSVEVPTLKSPLKRKKD